MSSPVDRDRDERSMYAPLHSRQDDPSDAVMEAAERLKQRRNTPHYEERMARRRHEDEVAARVQSDDLETEMGRIVRDSWRPSAFDPVPVPPPPKRRFGRTPVPAETTRPPKVTWPMAARVVGAVAAAALVALFVSGANPFASFGSSFSSSERNANAAMLADEPAGGFRTARMTPAVATEQVAAPEKGVALAAYAPPPASASTLTPADIAAAAPQTTAPQPGAPSVAAEPRVAAPEPLKLDRAEIASLLKRGQELVTQGDIAGGRLLLQRAADAGDAQAALALAATFDPRVLAEMKVIGVAGDEARAREWYKKAAALGSVEATRRLAQRD